MSQIERTMAGVGEAYQSLQAETAGGNAGTLFTRPRPSRWIALAASVLVIVSLTTVWLGRQPTGVTPNPVLTPGEAAPISKMEVCETKVDADNREVPEALQEAVFRAYGLKNAQKKSYEVDFLITPALGGAASIRNLWPEPYNSRSWNAHTKDVLEDRLHQLVCSGKVDLFTAQKDIATNWVDAYKKYVSR